MTHMSVLYVHHKKDLLRCRDDDTKKIITKNKKITPNKFFPVSLSIDASLMFIIFV